VRVNESVPLSFTELPVDTAPREKHRDREEETRRCGSRLDSTVMDPRRAGALGCVTQGSWAGGRFEIDVPPDTVLHAYRGWTDSLRFDLNPGDAERLEDLRREALSTLERLPDSLTGRPRLALAFDRFTDVWRYNRAEGASLGAGYEWRVGIPFVSLLARARYAFTDQRLQAALTVRRDAAASRLELQGFREMRDADPFAPGLTVANSFAATALARDDGDYVFVQGGAVRYLRQVGGVADLTLEARYADESAPRRVAHSGLNDLLGGRGVFQPNGPVATGRYWVATAELAGGARPLNWRLGAEGTAGTHDHARAWFGTTARSAAGRWLDVTASGWLGVGAGDSIPQRDFRLGGEKTLRGYPTGTFRGPTAWALSVDVGVMPHAVSPVLFFDAGQVASRWLTFGGRPAASFGAGLSLLGGAVRLDAARPVAPAARWRWSLTIGARR
jgi:hypothetical protein